ncbi:MAG: thiamine pyrophosphate-dependent enzyme [Nocardioidaceae bacterium]
MAEHDELDRAFLAGLSRLDDKLGAATGTDSVEPDLLLSLFDAQAGSRHLDIEGRRMRAVGESFYTIGSAGHEGNAGVAAALRPTDPALLHYRSGGFYLARAAQLGGHDGLRDVLLGLAAAADEPIAGGRHKVFGHGDLAVIPQTSTIGSHLPRGVGLAMSLGRAEKLGVAPEWPLDSVVVCSFGDASANHSTTVGAINTASQVAYQGLPLPLLLVCEDNGFGISVRTPQGWVQAAYSGRPRLKYLHADGTDVVATLRAAREAAGWARRHRRPVFLHLSMVRFLGHAGSDAEVSYRTPSEVAADLARDPLLVTARALVAGGACTTDDVRARYERMRVRVHETALEVARLPKLRSAAEVVAPLAPRRPALVSAAATVTAPEAVRSAAFDGRLPEDEGPMTLAMAINRALADLAASRPGLVIFGEDVGRKGGVYGVTQGLARRLGASRVFDTLLDEQSILGLALGGALAGLTPLPEIQYLAYFHNAADQIRGEAATLQFFSRGRYRNGMVVRIPGLAYQKGFGGHFHNDNSVAALLDIPGVVVAVPARADDAAAMLRTSVAAAEVDGTVTLFVEPIALYHTRDLHSEGDTGWVAPYAPPGEWPTAPIGSARTHGDGADLTFVTFGNGVPMSLRVARLLEQEGVSTRVVDLRWLAPLPLDDLVREAAATGRVLVVDETRRRGGVSESVVAALIDNGYHGALARVTSEDSFVPLGDAAGHVLLDEAQILDSARRLMKESERWS